MPAADGAPSNDLLAAMRQYGVGRIRRHIFLCADQTEPKCAPRERSLRAWEYLKRRLNELGLTPDKGKDAVRSILDGAREAVRASAQAATGSVRGGE
jgi:hypothetical protein